MHQLRRQYIEGHGAALAFRRGHQGAVDGHAVEVRSQAPHADKPAFALVALDADTGQALHRFGDVFIRQLRNAVGMHDALDAVGAALLLEGLIDAGRLADHFNVFCDRLLGGAQSLTGNGHRQRGNSETDEPGSACAVIHGGPPQESGNPPGNSPATGRAR
ncbi:hypothetical protein D3C81_1673250 [compost metagenome]